MDTNAISFLFSVSGPNPCFLLPLFKTTHKCASASKSVSAAYDNSKKFLSVGVI